MKSVTTLIGIALLVTGYICFIAGLGYMITFGCVILSAYFLLEPFLSTPEPDEVSIETTFVEIPPKDPDGKTNT